MVNIEIQHPDYAIKFLDELVATTHENYLWKSELRDKIQRAVLFDKFVDVWRPVESFPDYEISGGGMVRIKTTHRQMPCTPIAFGEVVTIDLRDRNGWWINVPIKKLRDDNFPELRITDGQTQG